MPVASAGKGSTVVGAGATRATKAAITPVLSVLEVNVDASTTVALDVGAGALDGGVAMDGEAPVGASAEVDQRPDVDADVFDGAGAAVGVGDAAGACAAVGLVKAEPGAFADGASTTGVGTAADERPADDAAVAAGGADDKVVADEAPRKLGRGGGFAAGGGDAAGAGRAGGTVGIADLEIGLLTVGPRGTAVEPAAEGAAGRFAPGEPGAAPELRCAAGAAACEVDGADCASAELACAVGGAD